MTEVTRPETEVSPHSVLLTHSPRPIFSASELPMVLLFFLYGSFSGRPRSKRFSIVPLETLSPDVALSSGDYSSQVSRATTLSFSPRSFPRPSLPFDICAPQQRLRHIPVLVPRQITPLIYKPFSLSFYNVSQESCLHSLFALARPLSLSVPYGPSETELVSSFFFNSRHPRMHSPSPPPPSSSPSPLVID